MTDLSQQAVVPSRESYTSRAEYRVALSEYIRSLYECERLRLGVEYGKCFCLCGGTTRIAIKTNADHLSAAGTPWRYLPYHRSSAPWKTPADVLRDHTDKTAGFGPQGDCWQWTGSRYVNGYGRFSFNRKILRPTRVAWELANNTPLPKGLEACHTCDNPPCVNPTHLFAGTQKDNSDDKRSKGRHAYGERMKITVLTNEQALDACRRLLRGEESQVAIAKDLGCKVGCINNISRGNSWRWAMKIAKDSPNG